MSSIGRLSEFNPSEESVDSYVLRLKHYFKSNDVKEDKRVSIFITVIGPKVLKVLSDIVSPSEIDSKTYDELVEVLKKHYSPKKLIVAERYTFSCRVQKPGESIADFVVAIKHLAASCEFGSFLKDALRDKLVAGLANDNIREKLLCEEKSFEESFSLALRLEQAEQKTSIFMSGAGSNSVDVAKLHVTKNVRHQSKFKCFRCGGDHKADQCSYSKYQCHQCKKTGHLQKMCKANRAQTKGRPNYNKHMPKVHELSVGLGPSETNQVGLEPNSRDQSSSRYDLYCLRGPSSNENRKVAPYKVNLIIENKEVCLELDTGSEVTVIPYHFYEKYLINVQLESTDLKLVTYSGDEVEVVGKARVAVSIAYGQPSVQLPIIVVSASRPRPNQPLLLGRNWLSVLKLNWNQVFALQVKLARPDVINKPCDVEALINKYNDVFHGKLGEIKGVRAQIVIQSDVTPKFCKARQVPYSLRSDVEKEIERLVNDGVAYPVTHSKWATPLVVVRKPNGVRLCADYKITVNPVIQSEHYPLPRPEDIFATLAGCSYFSVLDLASAYQQVAVAEESQHLLTVNTHKGLLGLRRLNFGLSSAPSIFQCVMDDIIKGLSCTAAYLDDILVGGETKQEAFDRLEALLGRLSEYGVRVNKQKCKFLEPEVTYLGHVLTSEGIKPSANLVKAIQDAPEPQNKEELRAYIGLLNYYRKFIPNLSSRLRELYTLLELNQTWKWSKACSDVFQSSKKWVLESNLLVHYDVSKPLILTCDASPFGVGAVLSHLINGEERPIGFASKTLLASEKAYSQLEREALGLVFGVKKFHNYIYGRKCLLQTDHKPLAVIFGSKRGVPAVAAARLQRWALLLASYNFEIKYRRGRDIPHADALSRLPLQTEDKEEQVNNHFSAVVNFVDFVTVDRDGVSIVTSRDVATETNKDALLSRVRDYVWYGWKNARPKEDPELMPFWQRREELSVDCNCIVWGSRVVIPSKLRAPVLRLLHDQHPGIVRMKLLARSFVWWPKLDKAIEEVVNSCVVCQSTRKATTMVPLQQWSATSRCWQRIHVDFAQDPFSTKMIFVVVDSYSKWVEASLMSTTTSERTIEVLRTLMAAQGLPEEVVSDNGSQLISEEFEEFLKKNGIKHTLSPPYHAQSNGAAERSIQDLKTSLIKQVLMEQNSGHKISLQHKLDNYLFAYRNTPHTVTGLIPAEVFLKRKPRVKLSFVKPNLTEVLESKQRIQKASADKIRSRPRIFTEGEKVWVKSVRQEKVSWFAGKILKCVSAVTYLVQTCGRTRFCHADHLRPDKCEDKTDEDFIRFAPDPPVPVLPPSPPVHQPATDALPDNRKSEEKQEAPRVVSPEHSSTGSPTRRAQPSPTKIISSPVQQSPVSDSQRRVIPHQSNSPPVATRRSQRTIRRPKKLDW